MPQKKKIEKVTFPLKGYVLLKKRYNDFQDEKTFCEIASMLQESDCVKEIEYFKEVEEGDIIFEVIAKPIGKIKRTNIEINYFKE